MKLLFCMLLLASPGTVELLDETSTIRAGSWNFYPSLHLWQRPVQVIANYEVLSPPKGEVRLAILSHADTERLFRETPHGVLAASEPGRRGTLTYRVLHPDDYDIVVDNRENHSDVEVRVRVSLAFGPPGPDVITAAPARQVTVVALSFAFFFGVVTYSARRILRAIGKG